MTYTTHRDTQETLQTLDRLDLDTDKPTEEELLKKYGVDEEKQFKHIGIHADLWMRVKPKVWAMFDEPYSSTPAKMVAATSIFFIVISILSFCLKTHCFMRVRTVNHQFNSSHNMIYSHVNESTTDQSEEGIYRSTNQTLDDEMSNLREIDSFLVARRRMTFMMTPVNVIDLIATLSFYADLVTMHLGSKNWTLEVFSIIRVMRLFKLTRHSPGLKILIHTFKASAHELSLLVFFLVLFIVVFASLVFYAERTQPNKQNDFTSIPVGL
ncbi:hypothetical protein HELRODRAFT_83440, partial [Helobdella robusta]|uniref:Ion transport domain-containing protein n=1 Tax=Helobdella robusta TaxID=6412 RepID=T1G556_HELRO